VLQYVADYRERYLEDCVQTVQRVFRRVPNLQTRCGKEVQHLEEIQEQRKKLKENMIVGQQMHLKSMLFERDNLQMELDEALN